MELFFNKILLQNYKQKSMNIEYLVYSSLVHSEQNNILVHCYKIIEI